MVREKVEEVLFLIQNYQKQFVIRNPESLNSMPEYCFLENSFCNVLKCKSFRL